MGLGCGKLKPILLLLNWIREGYPSFKPFKLAKDVPIVTCLHNAFHENW